MPASGRQDGTPRQVTALCLDPCPPPLPGLPPIATHDPATTTRHPPTARARVASSWQPLPAAGWTRLPAPMSSLSVSCCVRHSTRPTVTIRVHRMYVALHEVTWCMVVAWCTQNAPRRQRFHVAPAVSAL